MKVAIYCILLIFAISVTYGNAGRCENSEIMGVAKIKPCVCGSYEDQELCQIWCYTCEKRPCVPGSKQKCEPGTACVTKNRPDVGVCKKP
uniref:Venom peptide U14-SYTX-Sth1a n=1 Tax=Scytodes thoracica TaxID=1112478 RepID=A0A0A0V681_SCYTH|nr:venom peptide U14-SYTX-Sth1a [Scytodes thoracica]